MRSEFEFIHYIKKKNVLGHVGDDCAVLPKDAKTDLLVTADLLVEDIDFRLEWTTPGFLGHKALAVSLSDIAAMGGEPKWSMLSLGLPERIWSSAFLDEFYEGWHQLASHFNVELVGGDVSRVSDKLVIDSIVGGEVPRGRAVLRSGARPGDAIYVTGSLGGAAAGLRLLDAGSRYTDANGRERSLLLRQLKPSPQNGIPIRELGATAMIDISDGLSSDLAHLCGSSGVGAAVFADLIPIDRGIRSLELPPDEMLDLALNGGEDLELLFTANEKKISRPLPAPFHRIGEITANVHILELTREGITSRLHPKGYRHF
ncbi:MAG TPA: thiamine-phosphate kinase [Pyrinomonadaceae bacterium]|mgnify:CR=1 FL=1|nr:thiamine-phosphate kinase [Pyrinomonadaceae bacterium]HMP66282.1 thiamine-phosphate kinase [Pyrinomonadaceae bacterium]